MSVRKVHGAVLTHINALCRDIRLTLFTALRFMNLMATASSVSVSLAQHNKAESACIKVSNAQVLGVALREERALVRHHLLRPATTSSTIVPMPPFKSDQCPCA